MQCLREIPVVERLLRYFNPLEIGFASGYNPPGMELSHSTGARQ